MKIVVLVILYIFNLSMYIKYLYNNLKYFIQIKNRSMYNIID